MVDRECRVEKAPGAMLEILLSYSDSRRTELKPVNVLLSMQLIWLLRSILETHVTHDQWIKSVCVFRLNLKVLKQDTAVSPTFEISFSFITWFILYYLRVSGWNSKHRQRHREDQRTQPLLTQNDKTESWTKFKPGPKGWLWQSLQYNISFWQAVMWDQANWVS